MKPLHYTASALALGLALMGNAQAVTTIPFWHSMEAVSYTHLDVYKRQEYAAKARVVMHKTK